MKFFQKKSIQPVKPFLLIARFQNHSEILSDGPHQEEFGKARIQNERSMSSSVLQFLQDGPAKRRFPRSDFTRDLDKTFARFNSVNQRGKSIQMLAAEENKLGIRSDVEGSFL